MVRWPWKDTRGVEEWSKLPAEDQEYYRTATFTMEYERYPENWESTKEDYDHPDSPYELISEGELPEKGLHEYKYELKEDLRDELEYPRVKHHVILRIPIDWKDSEKLAKIIESDGKEEVTIVEVKKCPTCGHKI